MIRFDPYWTRTSRTIVRNYRRDLMAGVLVLLPFTIGAQTGPRLITPLKDAPLAQDADVKCLKSALETGDPDTGPSTFLLEAPGGCRVPAHYHTAEEQLIVIRGSVTTGMKGMHSVVLTAGGFAVMPSKAVHWFSCSGRDPCLMTVTFNQKYDIVWAEDHPPSPQSGKTRKAST
jgi:quercetin dioxygenase-like cupin family protein